MRMRMRMRMDGKGDSVAEIDGFLMGMDIGGVVTRLFVFF